MKKTLLLLFALLGLGDSGAWATVTQPTLTADESNPTYYVIQNVRSGKYANYAGASAQLTQVESASAGVNALWYFVENGAGKSLVPAADPTLKLASTSSATADGAVWYTPENPYNAGTFCVSLTSGATANCWDDQGSQTTIGYWQPAANDYQGTSWNIVEIPVTKAEVDAGTVNMTFALTKLDVLARLAPLSSLSVYTDANVAAVRNAADATALNTALQAFETNISLYCRSNKYLVVGESACSFVASPTGYEEAIQLESAGNGCFYLKGYKSEKYIGQVRQSAAVSTTATADESFYFENYNGYVVVKNVSGGGYAYIHNGGSGCVGWEPSGTNTQFTIAEVTLPAAIVNVTYHLMVDGVDKDQSIVQCGVGDAPNASGIFVYPYTTFTYDIATIAANTTDVYATANFNMPFTISADYDNATWYFLRGHASTEYYPSHYVSTNGTSIVWADGKSNTNAYKWAFIGNPVDGIKVINKDAGNGYYLTDTETATSMTTTATEWVLKQSDDTKFGLWSTNRNNYANAAGGTVKYWSQFDNGSKFWVEEIPAVSVDVTFNLVIGDEVVNTITQNAVAGNTTISVPASLTANYSTLGYDFTGNEDVNVGETNLTVNVTATLKTGVVTDLANLNNAKKYKLSTERGDLYIKNDHLASNSNANVGATAGAFAVLSYEDNYYLYSADASKFVLGDGSLSETPTSDIATLTLTAQTLKPLFLGVLGGKGLNVTNTNDDYELVINNWVTADAGNRYCIAEVADFDPTTALAALEEFFHPAAEAVFAEDIAALKAINFGTGLNQYGFTGNYAGYTSQAETIISGLETQGYSEENLQIAQALLANYAINLPATGFYRIKGKTSGKYLAAGLASNNKFAMSDATDGSTVFYYDGTKLTNFGSGMCNGMNSGSWAWVVGESASTVVFQDGLTNGGYGIKSATCNFYDNGDNSSSADRGNNVTINTSTNARYTNWYLESVTSLPITLNDGGDGSYYATFCVPFDVTLEGATAYTLTKDGATLNMSEGSTSVTGGTPVLLIGSGASATAAITPGEPAGLASGTLTGTYEAIAFDGDTNYVLGTDGTKVGFFHWKGTTLKGFRAYIAGAASLASVKGFYLNHDIATQIREMVGASDGKATYYDLSGRRVTQPARGLYIVNGKKVAVK